MDRSGLQDLDEDSSDDLDFDPFLVDQVDDLTSDDEDDGFGTEFTLTSDSPHTHSIVEEEGEEDDLLEDPPFSFDDLASGDALEELELWEELIGGEGNLDWPHDFGFLNAQEAHDSTALSGAGTSGPEDQLATANVALPAGTVSSPPRSSSPSSSLPPPVESNSSPRNYYPHATQMTSPRHPDQATGETSNKRQKTETTSKKDETENPWSEDDLFGDKDPSGWDNLETIDLTDATEISKDLKEPEEDNRIKLSTFQCVICMDDVSDLTVTHCGKSQ